MLKHTMTYIKGPRTMSSKESDHTRHNRRAIKKSGADTAAEADVVGMVAGESHGGGCWEGVPLTITPPSDKHQLDAAVETVILQKGIVPKAIAQMQQGAARFL